MTEDWPWVYKGSLGGGMGGVGVGARKPPTKFPGMGLKSSYGAFERR